MEIINLVDDSLSALSKKGNLSYAEELYNPSNYFKCVHHISFRQEDKDIKITNETIKVHILKTTRNILPYLWVIVDFFLCLAQILYIAKKNRICLIRGRAPYYASFFGLIVSKLTNVPLVVSIGGNHRLARDLTGSYPIFKSRFIDCRIEKSVLRNADLVICPNQFSKKYAMALGTSAEKTVVIPWRLKADIFNFTYTESDILFKSGVNLSNPIILYIGRLEKDKQVDILIETVPLIVKEYPNAQFVFIGDGSLMNACKKRAESLGILHNTYFFGFQTTESVKYCLKMATLVWIPMSGFVIFESAAASKAIVAFDVEWHSEFIENGKTGLLVENRNCNRLADAVVAILKEHRLADRLGHGARKLLEDRFRPEDLIIREIESLTGLVRA